MLRLRSPECRSDLLLSKESGLAETDEVLGERNHYPEMDHVRF
jgi:hypothetical protein